MDQTIAKKMIFVTFLADNGWGGDPGAFWRAPDAVGTGETEGEAQSRPGPAGFGISVRPS